MIVKGVVYKVFDREVNTKRGKAKAYSIKLDGDDNYYGVGFTNPNLTAGDYVSFDAGKNAQDYWQADPKSIRKMDREPTEARTNVASVVKGKDDYWNRKEARDLENDHKRNVGASLNTAIDFVELLLKAEAIQIPTKKSDREKIMSDLVIYYANKFRNLNLEPEASTTVVKVDPISYDEQVDQVTTPAASNWE